MVSLVTCGSPINVVAWFQEFLAEYNCVLEKETGSGIPGGIVEACWRPPDTGINKITDAALRAEQNLTGVEGHDSGSLRIEAGYSAAVAEAIVVLRGIQFAVDSGLLPVV
ncbi:hypothetical protein Dsin_019323 [Dipteronia sinensis]|uniref:Uncharacterized protein n=1 Tax=Dipteronia sinensis TaxID=43782 RepID=A0AAE0A703_9ROSI|nr:hypothetical protein Dsin_019323 [Dipteronia sinensis]